MIPYILVLGPVALVLYAYVGYPAILWVAARLRGKRTAPPPPEVWPRISITVPAYNEEAQIRGVIESLLKLDYPADRRQIMVISDASTDRTDEIVKEFADRGVELLRLPQRGGKGEGERAAARVVSGEIVVNTDASIRIQPHSLKRLIAHFADPQVGLASGRDVSVSRLEQDVNVGESGYVGYEMGIRRLETELSGIVGASGCFYAIRIDLHRKPLPPALSRDFASALITHENGYRAVSADDATCLVPRTASLHKEYRRKVRTIARGMQTLAHKRHLLNPFRHGVFAWMLFSHKVCRWLVPWAGIVALVGLFLAADDSVIAAGLFGAAVVGLVLAAIGWMLAERRPLPRLLSIPAYLVAGNAAAIHATFRAMKGAELGVWEPTRRDTVTPEVAVQR
jgi:cellulose synthase/poly-beta-1,6-N-acetylglucosamine synthase-like glycosyltransferase